MSLDVLEREPARMLDLAPPARAARAGPPVRVLALVADGFNAYGGIARYNQAFLRALAGLDHVEDVMVIPRFGRVGADELPPDLQQLPASPGRAAYVGRVLRTIARRPGFDLLFCGQINMVPLAAAAAHYLRCPWWLQIHGVDAWTPQEGCSERSWRGRIWSQP